MNGTPLPLILASTSVYRRELLARLGLPFSTYAPAVDETPRQAEAAADLVRRLSQSKASTGASQADKALVIGSDQVAVHNGQILGKPGSFEVACEQLARLSGQQVTFLTGICLYNSALQRLQSDVVPYQVIFRRLPTTQIENYVRRERPFDCAGSFKSEGLGIALFERMQGDDPTALIGLPLIRLVSMLQDEGVHVLA